ncbi:3-oxoacyl-[acyl-carrier protein] reductase [Hoeflea marina]|uniref:3-oxoacyl-[acyl-carrier protein] reductase n=1 Tax=Hoeflea marina TaxID=274592 RepID=A0A317PH55_9HYPH|nr:SDR family oxidoreductase [Hoeflea marina]PWV99958.1 3-oxoacyl-[acyl-carrier protein] reductase [Hoeflea marina]
MDLGLNGKRALVLASSRGLGLGVAEAIAAEGAMVMITGRDEGRLQAAVDAINARGAGRAHFVVSDLGDQATPALLEDAVGKALGGLDILVNNTGGPPPGPMAGADIAVVQRQFEMMVLRVMDVTARLLPAMREQRWGRVLTIASSGVIQPIPNLGLSNAIRAALVGWSKSMANEVAGDGVTFNMLLPGRIETDRLKELDAANAKRSGRSLEEVADMARSQIPVGRYGMVEEFASVAAFLVSDRASYLNGGMIRCDGGAIKSV